MASLTHNLHPEEAQSAVSKDEGHEPPQNGRGVIVSWAIAPRAPEPPAAPERQFSSRGRLEGEDP